MRKLWAFSLLCMFSLCATVAEAKVCFLPNVLIGGKCVSLSKAKYNDCKGFTETVDCESVGKAVIDTCTTEDGKTYYKCGCRGDVISWEVIKEHPGWLCETGYDDDCGCSAEHIFCSSEYKYRGDGTGKCAKSDENENSTGVGACALPNGRVYYRDCNCNGYPYECDGLTGLKAPTGVNEATAGCKSPHSLHYKYKECECADGWTSGSCESNTNGCLMPVSYVTANDGELTCALCDERVCKSNGESNLEAIYCAPKGNGTNYTYGAYLSETTTDCVDLGFVQGATGGFCPAGTKKAGETGVKCPFNGNYMFCEDQTGCHPTQEACENDISVKTCQDIGGCYRVSECALGYELNENTGACVVAECAEGFTTEKLDCKDAEHGLMHGYNGFYYQEGVSGDKDCEQCECDIAAARKEGYCKYTSNPADTENSIAAGEGILSVPCCDGSYSECRFDKGTTTPSEGTATHEKHEACNRTYYVATSCLEGYELTNGKCEPVSCDSQNGYKSNIKTVADCADSSGHKGAFGWSLTPQKDTNGHTLQSAGNTCYQCSCPSSEELSKEGCKWNASNKGQFGQLPEDTACCDGSNKSCKAILCTGDNTENCIPSSASVALCNEKPEHAISLKQFNACAQQTRCLVNECEQGYRPADDGLSCVFNGDCDASQGLILKTDNSGCECNAANKWASDPQSACTLRGFQYKDTDTCVKGGALYSVNHNADNSCHIADTSPNGTCDTQNGWYSDSGDACDAFGSKKGSSSWNTDFEECFGDYCYDQECILENGEIYPIHVNSAHTCVQVQDNLTGCNASQGWTKSGNKCVCDSPDWEEDGQGGCKWNCDPMANNGHDECPAHTNCTQDSHGCYVYSSCKTGAIYNPDYWSCDCDTEHGYKDDGNGNCVQKTCADLAPDGYTFVNGSNEWCTQYPKLCVATGVSGSDGPCYVKEDCETACDDTDYHSHSELYSWGTLPTGGELPVPYGCYTSCCSDNGYAYQTGRDDYLGVCYQPSYMSIVVAVKYGTSMTTGKNVTVTLKVDDAQTYQKSGTAYGYYSPIVSSDSIKEGGHKVLISISGCSISKITQDSVCNNSYSSTVTNGSTIAFTPCSNILHVDCN